MMPTKDKWILERATYQDRAGDFGYTVLHRVADTEYLSGTLRSALAEWAAFQDVESMAYFVALLMSGRVLVEVDVLSAGIFPELEQSEILRFAPGMLAAPYTDFNDAMAVPTVRDIGMDVGRCVNIFTTARELRTVPDVPGRIFMYIDFERILDWLRRRTPEIQSVAFDCMSDAPWVVSTENLVEMADKYHKFITGYAGRDAIGELRQISLAKHMPKSRRKN